MGPDQIQSFFLSFEKKIIKNAPSDRWYLKILVLSILGSLFYAVIYPLLNRTYPPWSRFDIIQDRTWYTLGLIALSPFYFYVSAKFRTLFFLSVMIFLWATGGFILGLAPGLWLLHPLSFLVMFLIITDIQLKNTHLNFVIKFTLLILVFLCDVLLAGYIGTKGDTHYLSLLSKLRFEYVLFFAVSLITTFQNKSSILLLHPLQLSHGIPLPESSILSSKHQTWWQGLFNITFGGLLIWVLAKLALLEFQIETLSGSLYLYFFFCLFVISAMNIITGLARIYGLEVQDGTYFLLLARSPTDFWRRSSTYLYQFILTSVYIPVFRRSRSIPFSMVSSILVSLFLIFFAHEILFRGFLNLIFPELKVGAPQILKISFIAFIYLGLWLAAEGIHRWLMSLIKQKASDTLAQWIAIILTHGLLVALTFFYLQTIQ